MRPPVPFLYSPTRMLEVKFILSMHETRDSSEEMELVNEQLHYLAIPKRKNLLIAFLPYYEAPQ